MRLMGIWTVGVCLAVAVFMPHIVFAATPTDACSLLTPAEVSAVLGVSVRVGEKIVPNSTALCGWDVPGEKRLDRKRVVLNIYTQIGSLTPIQRFNNAMTPITGITKVPVTGVGDAALFATTPGLGTGLIFRKGDAAFDLRVYGFPLDQVEEKERALAAHVLAKL